MLTKREKGDYVFKALTESAQRTQEPLLRELQHQDVPHRSYWIANMVWVQGDSAAPPVAGRAGGCKPYLCQSPVRASSWRIQVAQAKPGSIEWNIEKVGSPLVWAEGYTGEGVVVGGQDTGYEWQHPALLRQYRGWDGMRPIIPTAGTMPSAKTFPSLSERTVVVSIARSLAMTMGTVRTPWAPSWATTARYADRGSPGAKWIGCRNMENGWGTPASYAECYEWFVAPYPPGSSPLEGDPGMAPDIINNSWACPPAEGCTEPDILLTVVDNVRAAGILTVHSAGNKGAACSTVTEPAALYDSSLQWGARLPVIRSRLAAAAAL
jgi:serine protease AprX